MTRMRLLSECCNMLQSLIDKYISSRQPLCPCGLPVCDATVLGGFQKALVENQLLPLPSSHFTGLSILTLTEKLRKLELPSLCKHTEHMRQGYDRTPCLGGKRCGVGEEIANKMREIEGKPKGLSLELFKRSEANRSSLRSRPRVN